MKCCKINSRFLTMMSRAIICNAITWNAIPICFYLNSSVFQFQPAKRLFPYRSSYTPQGSVPSNISDNVIRTLRRICLPPRIAMVTWCTTWLDVCLDTGRAFVSRREDASLLRGKVTGRVHDSNQVIN